MRTQAIGRIGALIVMASFGAAWLAGAGSAGADGVIIIEPPRPIPGRPPAIRRAQPLRMLRQTVNVHIRDLAAVTEVDQVFSNPNSWQVEGTYLFPLPDEFTVNQFAMMVNGRKVEGELLDADKAREIYRKIVSKMRDPALLEFLGQRLYRAKIFPIPANGKVEVSLKYTGQLRPMAGLVTYRYPLRPDRPLGLIGRFEFAARIETTEPLSSVFCPTHEVKVRMKGPRSAFVKYKETDLEPDQDLLLHYRLSDEQFGLALLTYRTGGEDGFFMAWISPRRPEDVEAVPKDICFVIDTSGSMAESGGKKIKQAKQALAFCLQNLNRRDRFNIVSFSSDVRPFRDRLMRVSDQRVEDAVEYVDRLKAVGGTDINSALLTAMRMKPDDSDRPYMIVFLTDGLPTVGVTKPDEILRNVKKAADRSVRLFCFGVGYNVNTALLDKLAEQNRGTRIYVEPNEDLEVKLSAFYRQIASPAMTDIVFRVRDVKVYDIYPKQMPDLFEGTDLVVVGRYSGSGKGRIILAGRQGDEKVRFAYSRKFPRRSRFHDYLPRLWAMRKIGYLLDQMRLNGESAELKREVVDLAKRYGIVTPYTSFLITEDKRIAGATGGADRALQTLGFAMAAPARRARDAYRAADQAGAAQVEVSKAAQELREARDSRAFARQYRRSVPAVQTAGARRVAAPVQYVAGRAFYQEDARWVDSLYDGKAKPKQIRIFSDEYYKLLKSRPELKQVLSLARRVVFVADGQVYEVVD